MACNSQGFWTPWWWLRLNGRNMLEWLNNNKLINPKLICEFCWFVLFFNYENARSKNQNSFGNACSYGDGMCQRASRVQSDSSDEKIQVLCGVTLCRLHTQSGTYRHTGFKHNLVRTVTQPSQTIWYVPSHSLHTQSGTYSHTGFTHNLVLTVTQASHIIWYVPSHRLHTPSGTTVTQASHTI